VAPDGWRPLSSPYVGGLYGVVVKPRLALRAAVLVATAPALLVTATPALAVYRDDGDNPGEGLSPFATIGIYVGIPLALFALLALLVYAGSIAKGPRYRPDLGWWAAPVWFDGPEGGAAAALPSGSPASSTAASAGAIAATGRETAGGATAGSTSGGATAVRGSTGGATAVGATMTERGGASARW
jgi:hypothetical protein